MAVRLIIADGTSIHCKLLSDAVKQDRSIEVTGTVSTQTELIELSTVVAFDVALIALQTADIGFERFDTIRELRQ